MPPADLLTTPFQAERLVRPTNPQAVGAVTDPHGSGAGRAGGDTETGVRKWMARLQDKLKGEQPAPVVTQAESQDGAVPLRIELKVVDFETAIMPPTAA
jgi:hypothetical protein